ncbi:MAG: hypothetical protein Q9166_003909 [cf. Caloplaca sp. 2 TL-2023]
MDRLPQELVNHIASFVEREDDQSDAGLLLRKKMVSKLPPYATLSHKWQLAIESRTFHTLHMTSLELAYFSQVLTAQRRSFLSYLTYDIVLPTYEDHQCAKFETKQDIERNSQAFTYALHALLQFFKTWDVTARGDGVEKSDTRDDFATSLRALSGPSLRKFRLNFYHHDPSNQYFSPPSALIPSAPSTDHLSHALHTLSQSSNLTSLRLDTIVISPDLYWPANPSTPPTWPSLRQFDVQFHMTTPGGEWYFIRDPTKPIDEDEGENDSDDPDDADDETDTDSYTASSDSFRPDTFNERREARDVGSYPIRTFRTVPSDAHINPLLLAMARAAAHMPQLQSMSLTTTMRDPDGAGFEIYFHEAGRRNRHDSEPGDAGKARLYWFVGSWRPVDEVLKIWREKREGLLVRFIEW